MMLSTWICTDRSVKRQRVPIEVCANLDEVTINRLSDAFGIRMSYCRDVVDPVDGSSCCTPHDTAAHAARAMSDSGRGCAPVVENAESLKLVGVVTERDVCCSVAADDRRASEVCVEDIMRPESACCGADQPIEDACRQLHEHRSPSLPVIDEAGSCCSTVSAHRLAGP